MILVDSSVWIDHLRAGEPKLAELLNTGRVLVHPFVIGELACGNLKNRTAVLSLLQDLPAVPVATDDEVLFFIERHGLMGQAIGYVATNFLCNCIYKQMNPLFSFFVTAFRLVTVYKFKQSQIHRW